MTIVASNSITVSNVNDGTITHTAWAYNADGTDRFTTTYPNLNLLDGTSDKTSTKTGNNWNVAVIGVYNTPKVGQKYTVSVEVLNADHNVWMEVYRWNNAGYRLDKLTSTVIKSGEKGYITFTWPDPGNSGATQIAVNLAWTNGTDTGSYSYCKAKLEPGLIATPYMPSSSEATTADWPSYIGQYSDFTSTVSTDPAKYAPWTIFKGNDGVGVKTTVITYAISTSGTTAPITGWTSSVPSLVKGQYLWTKTVWTYTNNSSETGYSVTYISKDGNNGIDGLAGKDGVGITSTTITYQGSTSGTTAPTGTWSATVPTVAAGSYLWTKTVWAYTDNTSETGYSVAMMGLKGDKGKSVWSYPYDRGANRLGSWWSDLKPTPTTDNPPKVGDTIIDLIGNIYQIINVVVTTAKEGGGLFDYGPMLTSIKGPSGTDGTSGIIVSSVAPANPQTGQLWQDTSIMPQLVKKWTGNEWVIWEFYAENIKATTLETVSAKIGKIYNEFDNSSGGIDNKGTITIEDSIKIDYYNGNSRTTMDLVASSSGQGLFTQHLPDKTDTSKFKQSWYMPTGLYFSDTINNWTGQITAENVTLVPWTNLTYLSGFTTAENNPCQYRKIKNLDGSYTVQFRGQVKPVSGNFAINTQYNPIRVPIDAQPATNKFGIGIGDFASTQSARLVSFINDGANKGTIQVRVTGTASAYIAIDNLTYIL